MKFDLFKWLEVKPNEDYESPKGRLHIMCSQGAAVYVSAEGVEVLAGVGHEIDITLAQAVGYRVEAPEGARVFVENPRSVWYQSEGQRFTNDDRRPLESESVLEVKRALRQMKLEQSQLLRDMKREAARLERRQKRAEQPEPENQEPEAEVETETPAAE